MSQWPYSTQRWQKLRRHKLRLNPLCEACLTFGAIEPATTVDHKQPISQGGAPYPPIDGLTSLCTSCHSLKTACEQIGEDYMKKSCDVYGKPLKQ